MLRLAAGILDLEMQAARWAGFKIPQDKKGQAALSLGLVQLPILAAVSMTPYYSMYQAQAGMSWAVKDIAYTSAVRARGGNTLFQTYTVYNYAPKMLKYGSRGGMRLLALKVGARFIPYAGWALFAYDLWSLGKWIGEKTSPV